MSRDIKNSMPIFARVKPKTWKLLHDISFRQRRSKSVILEELIESKRRLFELEVDRIR